MEYNEKYEGLTQKIGNPEFPEDVKGDYINTTKGKINSVVNLEDINEVLNDIEKEYDNEIFIKKYIGSFSTEDAKTIEERIRKFKKSVVTLDNGSNGFVIDFEPSVSDIHTFEICENGIMRAYLKGYEFFAREIDSVDSFQSFVEEGGRCREPEEYLLGFDSYKTIKKIITGSGNVFYTTLKEYDSIQDKYEENENDESGKDNFLRAKKDFEKKLLKSNETNIAEKKLKNKLNELGIEFEHIDYETSGHNSQSIIKVGGKDLVNVRYETYSNGTIRYMVHNLKEDMIPDLLQKAKILDNEHKENTSFIDNFNIVEFSPKFSNIEQSNNQSSISMVAPMVSGNLSGNSSKYYTGILGDYKIKVGNEEFYLIINRSEIDQFSKSGSFNIYRLSKDEYKLYKENKHLYKFKLIETTNYEITGWTSSIDFISGKNNILSKILEKDRRKSNREKSDFIYNELNKIGFNSNKISELFKSNSLQVILNFAIAVSMGLEKKDAQNVLKYNAWNHLNNIIPNNKFQGYLENIHKGLELYIKYTIDGVVCRENIDNNQDIVYSTDKNGDNFNTINFGE